MIEKNYKAVIEDSSRNKFLFYYSGSSVCCKEILKDGITRDTIVASQVNEDFLTAMDLQDNIYLVCQNSQKGLLLYSYEKNEWKLNQILNIQGNGSVHLLSLYVYNASIHIIYAKQMTIANFYNVYHLHKPGTPNSYPLDTTWRKNNVCEIFAENLNLAYSSGITKDGIIHMVSEWYDGSNYLINYCSYDKINDGWKKKTITSLFKKDITVSILFDDSFLHLICYSYEDEVSAIFYYSKRDGSFKDFDFYCLDKIKTDQTISPYFHIESGSIYASWINDNKFYQYALNREQKSWTKKLESIIPNNKTPQAIEFIRNRKGKSLIVKKTYFSIDYKYNLNLPYFKENSSEAPAAQESLLPKGAEGDLVRYIPYILDELKSLSDIVKDLKERLDSTEVKHYKTEPEPKKVQEPPKMTPEQKQNDNGKLKKSSFRDQFMNSNKLLTRPDAASIYVGTSSIPNPDELTKKDEIEIVENQVPVQSEVPKEVQSQPKSIKPTLSIEKSDIPAEDQQIKQEIDQLQKDTNLFKKIGDFFK